MEQRKIYQSLLSGGDQTQLLSMTAIQAIMLFSQCEDNCDNNQFKEDKLRQLIQDTKIEVIVETQQQENYKNEQKINHADLQIQNLKTDFSVGHKTHKQFNKNSQEQQQNKLIDVESKSNKPLKSLAKEHPTVLKYSFNNLIQNNNQTAQKLRKVILKTSSLSNNKPVEIQNILRRKIQSQSGKQQKYMQKIKSVKVKSRNI